MVRQLLLDLRRSRPIGAQVPNSLHSCDTKSQFEVDTIPPPFSGNKPLPSQRHEFMFGETQARQPGLSRKAGCRTTAHGLRRLFLPSDFACEVCFGHFVGDLHPVTF